MFLTLGRWSEGPVEPFIINGEAIEQVKNFRSPRTIILNDLTCDTNVMWIGRNTPVQFYWKGIESVQTCPCQNFPPEKHSNAKVASLNSVVEQGRKGIVNVSSWTLWELCVVASYTLCQDVWLTCVLQKDIETSQISSSGKLTLAQLCFESLWAAIRTSTINRITGLVVPTTSTLTGAFLTVTTSIAICERKVLYLNMY